MRASAAAVVACLGAAASLLALVERDDRDDDRYLALGRPYEAVGAVVPDGTGTLIAPRWVLTAAHVAGGRGGAKAVRLGGRERAVGRVVLHPQGQGDGSHPPEVDLALLELERPVEGIEPLDLYRDREEAGKTAVLVGCGDFGKAGTRLTRADGQRRAATNVVADAGPRRLFFAFEAPPGGTDLEGASGPGDSGGPALLDVAGRPRVAGVSSGAEGPPGRYGLTDVFVRVSAYAAWIDGVVRADGHGRRPFAGADPTPASPSPSRW